ncbi:MAG: tetratricopeptide repeat protein [Wenzhouxiangellaceae bacterium]|nr:tetratricopeptide repeat protein [Wenzhouxiangellaceae bacterium]
MRTILTLLILSAAAFVAVPAPVAAQQPAQACGEPREGDPGLLSEATYRRLNDIFEKIGEELYNEAYNDLRKMEDGRLSEYERASVLQAMGFIASQQEQWRRAIDHFQEAIDLNVMPNQVHFEMILQTAQLYNILEEYDRALERLDYWFCVSTEEAQKQATVWVLKASLHVQKEEYRQALEAIDTAIGIADDPKESWYRLKLGMHFELKQYPEAVETLKTLITMDPDRKDYWVQMSGAYMELEENEEAMSALRLAYRRGLLDKGTEYVQLAGLLQELEAPRQAAAVLTEGIERGLVENTAKNWEMVAGAWYQAREMDQALDAYDRAGALSDEGKLDFQRASILAGKEDWPEVVDAAGRALEKGGLSENQRGNAYLLLGMAHFNLGNFDAATQNFNQARDYEKLRRSASEWLNHIRQSRQSVTQ